MQRVFVFGTLKEGFPNFRHNKGVRITGRFRTVQKYPLFLVGDRFSPWLIDQPRAGKRVSGQVYEVGSKELEKMDQLERITAPDGYRRKTILLENLDNLGQFQVYAYLKPREQLVESEIREGPIAKYTRFHASKYLGRVAEK